MAPPEGPAPGAAVAAKPASGLALRLASALVLAPVALAALWFGTPFAELLVAVMAGSLAWELARLVAGGRFGPLGWIAVGLQIVAIGAGALGDFGLAGWIVVAGAMAVVVLHQPLLGKEGMPPAPWSGFAVLYVAVPSLAFLWLRQDPAVGRELIFWLLLIVWASDIGAYAAGRTLGGPRLAPAVSPNKTWAGFFGGLLASALVALLVGLWLLPLGPLALIFAGAFLSLATQLGDLFESALKRHFGVKDSSQLIPGHGGVLDRLDGLMFATVALALAVTLARGGA